MLEAIRKKDIALFKQRALRHACDACHGAERVPLAAPAALLWLQPRQLLLFPSHFEAMNFRARGCHVFCSASMKAAVSAGDIGRA